MNRIYYGLRAAVVGIIAMLTGLTAQAQQKVSANYVPTIYGIVLNSGGWADNNPIYGVYSFMPNQQSILPTLEHAHNTMRANSGGVWFGGRLYFMNSLQDGAGQAFTQYQCWDTQSWEQLTALQMTSAESPKLAADLTYDPTTETVYGLFFTDDGTFYEVGTMTFSDDATPEKQTLRRLPIQMVAIAASPTGSIYGIGINGALYQFNKSTGEATVVGNTGVTPSQYRQSATFDFRSGKLYWAAMLDASTSALYEVDPATGHATRIAPFAHHEEVVALYIPFGLSADGAPSTAEQLAVNFPDGGLTGTFSFTIPTENYATDPLTGQVDYRILVDNNEVRTGTSEAGASVSEELTLTQGSHTFAVILSNSYGEGQPTKLSAYIGHDVPVAPTNLQLTIDNDNLQARLTWDTPARGQNGGYIDSDNILYVIKRYPGPVTLETDYEGNLYIDELPETTGIASYSYTLQAYYDEGRLSAEASTPTINVGHAFEMPWTEDFSKRQNFSQFTVINANDDQWTWVYNSTQKAADCHNGGMYDADNDDWLITPPLHLLGDRIYDLEFEASSNWAWDRAGQEQLEVGMGDNASAQNYEWVVERRIIQQQEENIPVKVAAKLRPSKDGTYFLGFHCVTPMENAFHLYIHNITVKESSLLSSPDSVTNLRLEPAAKGVLRATVKFNAPTKDLAGNELTTLTQIQVLRDGDTQEVLATFNAPEPGQELSYVDSKCTNGVNSYLVVPFAGDNRGQATSVSGWVGIDYPSVPQNVKAVLQGNTIRVTWDAPTEVGLNGGYVDAEDLYYQVYDKNGQLVPGADELYDNEFTISGITLDGAQATNQYYVLPWSELGAGDPAVSNVVVTGDPYPMPLHESFANGSSHYLWWMTQENGYYTFTLTRQESSDDDGGALYMPGSEYFPTLWAQIGSGKISMKGSQRPMWTFSYRPFVGRGVVITAKVMTPDFVEHEVARIEYSKLTGANDWRRQVIDLTPYKDEEWVIIMIHAVNVGTAQVLIDDINVEEAVANDLAATLYAPKTMRIGTEKNVNVTVTNLGLDASTDYTVRLYANDRQVAQQPGVAIASQQSRTFEFPYSAPVNAPEELKFHAVVDFAADSHPADNTTEQLAVSIKQPLLPGVRDFAGEARADGQVVLTWQQPDLDAVRRVVDDFEDYSAWTTNGFGPWQVIDQDNARTYDMSGSIYPNQSMQTAFMIFNNSETSGTRYSNMNGHSGEQVAASFDAIPAYSSLGRTADWLISPELSGEAQTVEFFARSVSETYLETMEVAYTTGAATTRSGYKTLKTVDGVPNAWTEYSVELPAGAKHFAIKNTSRDKMALIVDDVAFEPTPLQLQGYDVYVDGWHVATVTEPTFTTTGDETHSYQVCAIYDRGTSALSTMFGTTQGIGFATQSVDLDTADLRVYTLDGVRVAEGRGVYRTLRSGVYVVTTPDGQSHRVVKR